MSAMYIDWNWRTGRKVGRTIYAVRGDEPSDRDVLIGIMDSAELATASVEAHNALLRIGRDGKRGPLEVQTDDDAVRQLMRTFGVL